MTIIETGNVIGIVRYRERSDLGPVLEALTQGGIALIEVTLDTPGALDAIASTATEGNVVGAGTVLEADQVRACAGAGARFVVSPGSSRTSSRPPLASPIPGVLSPTERLARPATRRVGGEGVPRSGPAGGPRLIDAPCMRRSLDTALVPTGGIDVAAVASISMRARPPSGWEARSPGTVPDDRTGTRRRAGRAAAAVRGSQTGEQRGLDVIALGETMLSLVARGGSLATATEFVATHGGAETNTLVWLAPRDSGRPG